MAISFARNAEGRRLWLDVLKGINAAVPQPTEDPKKTLPKEEEKRTGIYIEQVESKFVEDVKVWYDGVVAAKWPNAPDDPNVAAAAGATDPNAAAAAGSPRSRRPGPDASTVTPPAALIRRLRWTPPRRRTRLPYRSIPARAPADPRRRPRNPQSLRRPPRLKAPTGPGFIIQMSGYHYHNSLDNPSGSGVDYVKRSLLENLQEHGG